MPRITMADYEMTKILLGKRVKQVLELQLENRDLRIALTRAEQTIRNLGNAALTGDYRQIALNEAANLRATIGE